MKLNFVSRKHLGAYDWFPGSGIYTCVYIEISERKHIAEPTGKKINSLERLGVVEKLCSAYKNDQWIYELGMQFKMH